MPESPSDTTIRLERDPRGGDRPALGFYGTESILIPVPTPAVEPIPVRTVWLASGNVVR